MSNQITRLEDQAEFPMPRAPESEIYAARQALERGHVPDSAIKTRKGKGGKDFTYVSHIWLTEQIRNALSYAWDFNVLDITQFPDGSIAVRVELRVHVGNYVTTITEIGAAESMGEKVPMAYIAAKAASRGLARCAMRRWGIGQQFYEDEVEVTISDLWELAMKEAEDAGVPRDELLKLREDMGITRENLESRYLEFIHAIRTRKMG